MDTDCRADGRPIGSPGFAGIWTLGAKIHFPGELNVESRPIPPAATLYYEV
jgi:hypothetical protein